MVIMHLLGWWYSYGWAWAIKGSLAKLKEVNEAFSIPILLRTWFAPWKQIQSPTTFSNFIQSSVDNLVSRSVGATVRTGMIFGALLASFLIIVFTAFIAVFWPVLPLLVLFFPVLFIGRAA